MAKHRELALEFEQNKNMPVDGGSVASENEREGRVGLAQRRELNDRLRIFGAGGIVVMTEGIAALGATAVNRVFARVAAFDSFTPDNDPWGEHDCALLTVDGVKVLWKIDYFDRSRRFRSPDPANPNLTVRIMTVMRADEY